jgi:hypothetical protein
MVAPRERQAADRLRIGVTLADCRRAVNVCLQLFGKLKNQGASLFALRAKSEAH